VISPLPLFLTRHGTIVQWPAEAPCGDHRIQADEAPCAASSDGRPVATHDAAIQFACSTWGGAAGGLGMTSETRDLIDALAVPVWIARGDGRIDGVNRAWRDFTGMEPGQDPDEDWRAGVHPQDLPALLERLQAIIASGRGGEMLARLHRFDGCYRRSMLRVRPLVDVPPARHDC
jgi:PAS domain-containing protein